MVKKIIGIVLVIVVLGALIPVLWPMMMDTGGVVGNMTGSDAGTSFIKAMWPVILIIVGIGIAAGLIYYALKKFNIVKK